MSFETLPENWPTLPLDDPHLLADVVDLVVGERDRSDGCVGLLLLDDGMRLAQPCVVGEVPDDADPADFVAFLDQVAAMVHDAGGAVAFVRGRDGAGRLTDADRAWHEAVLAGCRRADVRLLGAFLATPSGVRTYPEPLAADEALAS
ncbi:hypothetical protein KC207_11155 [Phycicoccus sp. BSK3Z-2]|uniref:Uncharacterized protein n=1 Tax=Phycicoccus avicenniae TaxID=2828860 RepID=A0A941D8K3_9MICO|nr:hypothetical protein [Phycicoccus avicenniae]MBR7743848.1 hypothetical protein [Phycicoccus avicenniae]